ncbi:AraC family transcriptional regulator [Gordonia rubripertincta]|uniref:AraC family transcriptional regulator n=1 Tax=Gordonia rubripertincta TaxID=36822 RepID=UPI0015F9E83C|nr:AraC family transcriptional regulator [Gordonia rubripertincta]QMU22726.1 AraC family transcriptional regulator [Gordonia rubripertincta]
MSTQHTTQTSDWEAAHRAVEQVYFPHELTALSSPEDLELSLQTVDLGPVTIGRLNWGTEVSIACDYPDAYEINIPVSGVLESRAGSFRTTSEAGQATVFTADRPSLITRWSADCQVVGVKFDAEYLEREADRVRAAPLRSQLLLPHQLDLSGPDEQSWFALVRALSAQLREPADLLANPLVGPQLASAVSSAFILAVSPEEAGSGLRPRMVKRVLDALHDDPAREWRLADMAEIGGSSLRRLQEGFAEHVGATPTQTLRDIRLSRARADLLSPEHTGTVAEVAARWGFSSPSRFAAAYRKRYGIAPSEHRRLA